MTNSERSWVVDIENQLKDVDTSAELFQWRKHSIYKVPGRIKDLNPKAYKPQVVSFGPYHYSDEQLKLMEAHKHRALLHFLKRADKPFEEFLSSLEEVVEDLQECYQSLDEKWKSDNEEFLKLMVVDGCFMIEILTITTGGSPTDYAFNDPVFSSHGMLHTAQYIKGDMLMVENQLPLLVLEKLVAVETGKAPNDDLINKLVLKFCAPDTRPLPSDVGLGLHPLDLFRKSLLQGPPRPMRLLHRPERIFSEITCPAATELNEAGISLKRNRTNSLQDIRFKRGVLSLPVIFVDDDTEYMFLNLMAFERLHIGAGNQITFYIFFMNNIANSARDVSLLHSKGIVQNAVGTDKAVAKLFNRLSKGVTLDPESSLYDVHWKVNAYCRTTRSMWRANLVRTYFRSPWSFLSLAASIFLLVMTVAQTLYSILPYYHPERGSSSMPPPIALSPH